ncbi:hypothetical protein SKAU_G00115660 [Synaphobranchus kaupii]|uniref:DDE-1 domain-containing protein n=1 Tax=Synaphobranchus kaupii TaxID=118154 RepID=A0A9Q1J1Z2_SYNKA|nr:hypothetical protein SKAU_G00115660 [Synaphobranchus kaupii]
MPRFKPRKTNRGSVSAETLSRAADEVIRGGAIKTTSRSYGICHMTLRRFVKARQDLEARGITALPHTGYRSHTKVFSEAQEANLVSYLKRAAQLYYGLNCKEVRKLAYELAKKNNCKYAASWEAVGMASQYWMTAFSKRHPSLSIWARKGKEATSLSQATSFNAHNVSAFFDNLANVLGRHPFTASTVWNVDETGISSVQVPDTVVAEQDGAVTSAGRGQLVTMALAVSAEGLTIPPHFVFPRKKLHPLLLRNGPAGSVGTANGSGWMQGDDFVVFLQHFTARVKPTPERRVLLLLDNHASHLSLKSIDYCRSNNITLLSFPPHCSHKLQPLDRSVFGPLKRFLDTSVDGWMRANPGSTLSIYDVAGMVRQSLPLAATPGNIQAGFRCTGVWPYNRAIFKESDVSPSFVTDRPPPPALSDPVAPAYTCVFHTTHYSPDVESPPSQPSDRPPPHLLPPVAPFSVHPATWPPDADVAGCSDLSCPTIMQSPSAQSPQDVFSPEVLTSQILTDAPFQLGVQNIVSPVHDLISPPKICV